MPHFSILEGGSTSNSRTGEVTAVKPETTLQRGSHLLESATIQLVLAEGIYRGRGPLTNLGDLAFSPMERAVFWE